MTHFRFFRPAQITWGKTVNMEPKIQLHKQETIAENFKVVNNFIMALLFTSPSNIMNRYQRQRRVYHLHVHLYPEEGSISLEILMSTYSASGSQWSRGLRRRSSTARLLKLWVRIPPVAWMLSVVSVSVVYCQVEVSATSWAVIHRSPTECAASLFVI